MEAELHGGGGGWRQHNNQLQILKRRTRASARTNLSARKKRAMIREGDGGRGVLHSLFMGFYVCHFYAVNRISMFHVEANGHVNTINRQRPPVPIFTHHDNSSSVFLWR